MIFIDGLKHAKKILSSCIHINYNKNKILLEVLIGFVYFLAIFERKTESWFLLIHIVIFIDLECPAGKAYLEKVKSLAYANRLIPSILTKVTRGHILFEKYPNTFYKDEFQKPKTADLYPLVQLIFILFKTKLNSYAWKQSLTYELHSV